MKKISFLILIFSLLMPISYVNAHTQQTGSVKYSLNINFPVGQEGKTKYMLWVAKVVPILNSFDEVQSIVAYDNYFGVNPHRLVEFYFTDIKSAATYWSREEVKEVLKNLPLYSNSVAMSVFVTRADYQ